jgi:hypothetical protein
MKEGSAVHISRQLRASASGKADDLRARNFPAHALDDAAGRLNRPACEFARRQHAGPGVENLQRVGTGLELAEQILDRVLYQHIDDPCERIGVTISHQPCRGLVRGALSCHHVGCNRPWRAAEADQRRLRIEFAADAPQGLKYRLELFVIGAPCQCLGFLRCVQRIEPWTFAGFKLHRAAERMGDDKDVGEDDRGIEVEASYRLQRHFGGIFGREAEIEKAAGFGSQFPIFRQIAAGLPHHPDRRNRLSLAGKHIEERFGGANLGQTLRPVASSGGKVMPLIHCRCGQGQDQEQEQDQDQDQRETG